MADGPPAGGDGGVHYVNENQFKNIKLSVGALGNTIFERGQEPQRHGEH
ncbi:hypothetical protein PAHAL_3G133600 [Panicum hallii]|uniref:Uncharacterized protein n=1 Tax=Panicum hallii TaxID=206008 RepID=A0A2S3H8R8_9POAL|nr:hypothetical protein PAHAL_3G133600 [Panicum hallii]